MENEKEISEEKLEVAEPIEKEDVALKLDEVSDEEKEVSDVEVEEETKTEKADTKEKTEEDTKYAAARRRAESEYKARLESEVKKAYEKGVTESNKSFFMGKENPYTGKPIEDEFDIKEYQKMYELDQQGSTDILKDYAISTKESERKKETELIKQNEEKAKQEKDINDFLEKYPNIELKEMFKEPKFKKFINGKIGNQPLIEIYEDYNELIGNFKNEAESKAKAIVANTMATPGSLNNGESKDIDFDSMSDEDFEKYDKAISSGKIKFKR